MRETYYRMRPEFRRIVFYVAASFPLFGLAFYTLINYAASDSARINPLLIGVPVAAGLPVLALLRWRICVDEIGLSRRRFWSWDLWDWSDFSNGRIRKGRRFFLFDSGRPWWRPGLNLEFLDDLDREQVVAAVNRHYRLPGPPPTPDEMQLKMPINRWAVFDWRGLVLSDRKGTFEYAWG